MTTTVNADFNTLLHATCTRGLSTNGLADPQFVYDLKSIAPKLTLNATSTPAVTQIWGGDIALIAGAKTLDLTALTATNQPTLDMTGLHLRAALFVSDSANANSIQIATGASNGYTLGTIILPTAKDRSMIVRYGSIAVDSSHKTLDMSGTLVQIMSMILLFG